ncbi:ethanolamine utilization protein EutH [Eubacteriales bacterium OttesenSCG-928-N13]|nr:ethanolamine utilization protein EutH [Eubacteriales bacterium OttesenSCG-928-N13]
MSINEIIIWIMVGFMVFSAIDKLFLNNRFGYGEKFDDAFNAMGPLALSIVGIMCFAPVLGNLLTPVFTPLFQLFGADPAMLAGSILASDMGGYALAGSMTTDPQIQALSGILLGSMMGIAIIFVIPYTATVIEKEDMPYLSSGIMAGIIPIPIGCLIGGLISGISFSKLIVNLIPVAILAAVLALCLWLIPRVIIKLFSWFSKIITWLIGITLVCAIIEALTGFVIIPGMAPIADQFSIVGLIAITLAGAYPFIHFLTTVLKKPLSKLGGVIGINEVSVAGMLACLASSIPMYPMVKDMDPRGKVMSIAFSICAGFCLGDILGYTSANAPEYIFAMIAGKLLAGVIAAWIGAIVVGKMMKRTDKVPTTAKQSS